MVNPSCVSKFFNCTSWSIFFSDILKVVDAWVVMIGSVLMVDSFSFKVGSGSEVSEGSNKSSLTETHFCHTSMYPGSQSHFLDSKRIVE